MNKKITIRRNNGELLYCILSGDKDLEEQFNVLFFNSENPAHGICARFDGSELAIVDYYHNERMEIFDIVSIEDTDGKPILKWMDCDTENA